MNFHKCCTHIPGVYSGTLDLAPTDSAAQAPQVTVSVASSAISSMVSHLAATTALATQLAAPTNMPNTASHALPGIATLTVVAALLSLCVLW